MANQISKRLPVLKSHKVETDVGHDHKLWWINIEQQPDGRYQLFSYAQIFSDSGYNVKGEEIRKYVLENVKTFDQALATARLRYNKKKSDHKGYSQFKERDEFETNLTQDIINEFLKRYGQNLDKYG